MNLFHFLTSTRGAIKPLNALLISAAAGGVFAYTVGTVSDHQIEAERRVRTLSSITSTSPQQGMLQRGGQLTSINVGDSGNRLATPEERAAFQSNRALDRYMANQRALEGMDGALGRAAQFSESDGLNTGNREVAQTPGQFVQGASKDIGESVETNIYRSKTSPAGAAPAGASGKPSLAPATMTRASGSNFGATSGGIVGGPGSGSGPGEGARLSGAMPGGTNIISQRGLDKGPLGGSAGTSAFRNGRDSRITRGLKSGQGKNELDDIAKRSARAAASNSPSANEGAQAFLAGATRGGVVVSSAEGESEGGTVSEDLKNPSARKLKAIGNHLQNVEDKLTARERAQSKLTRRLLLTLAISLGAMAAGLVILNRFKSRNFWYWAIAAALMGVVVTANAVLFNAANHFIRDYSKGGGLGMAWLAKILSPFLVAGMGYVILEPSYALRAVQTLWHGIKMSFKTLFKPVDIALGSIKNTIVNSLMGSIFK